MKVSKIIYHLQNSESDKDEFVDFSTRVRHYEDLTLADFKTITRRFGYRYYFLAVDPEFGLIKAAIETNNEILPSFNGIMESWLFEDERKQYNKLFTEKQKSLSLLSKKTPSWKRLLDLIEDFEATHQRKNQRYTELELSTSGLNGPEQTRKQNGTREYLETSFFTAEPVEIIREDYSTSARSRKLYPLSSSPIRSLEQSLGNVSSAPEFWSIRSETTQKMFPDGNLLSDIDRSNKSTSKSCGSFSKSETPSFGTEPGVYGPKSTLNDPEQEPNEVLLTSADAHDSGPANNEPYIRSRRGPSPRHEEAITTRAQDDFYTGTCKHRSTDYNMKRIQEIETCRHDSSAGSTSKEESKSAGSYVDLAPPSGQSTSKEESKSAGSYVDLAPPSGQSTSKEESKTDLIKSDMKYFNLSNQNNFGDAPNEEEPLNNTKESDGSPENRFLVNQKERPKDTYKRPKIRRPLQYVIEPEVLRNDVAESHKTRHGAISRFKTVSKLNSPVKPPRTFEYVKLDTNPYEQNPFRETGTHSIRIGNLTTKSRASSFGRDGSAKPRRSKGHKSYCDDPYRNTCSHTATRVCSPKTKEHRLNDRAGDRPQLPDVCLSLFDVSKMSRDISHTHGMHPGRSPNAPKTTPSRSCALDKYGYQTCLRHRSVMSIKNLSTPGHIPSSCLSLCNYSMNRVSSSACVRNSVNTERDAELLVSVEPPAGISEQIENLTSDCEVCKLNDKNADDVISESVLSLYDFKMADIEIGGKTTSARNLHKDSMACCRSQ